MLSVNIVLEIIFFLVILERPSVIKGRFRNNKAFRIFDVNGTETILALENEEVSMLCKTGMPMAYCGFIHPSGKRYSFSGNSLINGHCAVKIRATKNDTGYWKCHIGEHTGTELSKNIELRVVGKLAAIDRSIMAIHGKKVTLNCVTVKEKLPLKYCRFEPPNGKPFSIDSATTATQPLLNKYYYPQNKSLGRGDCAVTIAQVRYSDVGEWTCGAGFNDSQEHIDHIRLHVEGLYTMSTASITGVSFGVLGVIAFLAILGVVAWKKRTLLGTVHGKPEVIEVQELQQRPKMPSSSRSPTSISPIVAERVQSPSEPQLKSPFVVNRVVSTIMVQSSSEPRLISPMVAKRVVPTIEVQSPAEPPSISPLKAKRVVPTIEVQSPSEPRSISPLVSKRVVPTIVVQSPSEPISMSPLVAERVVPTIVVKSPSEPRSSP